MGLFDYVRCEMPLPGLTDLERQTTEFQTKDFTEPYMETYTITKEGRLLFNDYDVVEVPLEERTFYKPGMDPNSLRALGGCIKRVPIEPRDLEYHGILHFYGSPKATFQGDDWIEFNAKFTDGQLVEIKRVEA